MLLHPLPTTTTAGSLDVGATQLYLVNVGLDSGWGCLERIFIVISAAQCTIFVVLWAM